MTMEKRLKERGGELETPWVGYHGYRFRAAWRSKAVPGRSTLQGMSGRCFPAGNQGGTAKHSLVPYGMGLFIL